MLTKEEFMKKYAGKSFLEPPYPDDIVEWIYSMNTPRSIHVYGPRPGSQPEPGEAPKDNVSPDPTPAPDPGSEHGA